MLVGLTSQYNMKVLPCYVFRVAELVIRWRAVHTKLGCWRKLVDQKRREKIRVRRDRPYQRKRPLGLRSLLHEKRNKARRFEKSRISYHFQNLWNIGLRSLWIPGLPTCLQLGLMWAWGTMLKSKSKRPRFFRLVVALKQIALRISLF